MQVDGFTTASTIHVNTVRMLSQYLQTKILHNRHQVGERELGAVVEDLEMQITIVINWLIEAHG